MRLHSFAFVRIFDRSGTLDVPEYTCVSSPFPRPLPCILPSFFPFLQSLAQKFDTRFSLCFDHPAAFPPPPFRDVFYYFSIIFYFSRTFCDCSILFLYPSSLVLWRQLKKIARLVLLRSRRLLYRSSLSDPSYISELLCGDVKAN